MSDTKYEVREQEWFENNIGKEVIVLLGVSKREKEKVENIIDTSISSKEKADWLYRLTNKRKLKVKLK